MGIKAQAKSFIHLIGLSKVEDDDKNKTESSADDERKEGETDEEYEKRTGKKAEKDDEQRDDESNAEYEKRTGKKGSHAEDSDDGETDAEDEKDEKSKAARQRESTRCAKIIAHGVANGCVNQAGVFAFDTRMTAKQAIAALTASRMDGNKANGLGARMAGTPIPRVGTDAAPARQLTVAEQILAAGAKRRGETA